MTHGSTVSWYSDTSGPAEPRYFDGTQPTEYNYAIGAPEGRKSRRSFYIRLVAIVVMLAATVFCFAGAASVWHAQHSGVPARVAVTDCSTSAISSSIKEGRSRSGKSRSRRSGNSASGFQCWGETVINGETRHLQIQGPDAGDIGKTFDARIDEHGVAWTADPQTPRAWAIGGLVFLVVTLILVARAVALGLSRRRYRR